MVEKIKFGKISVVVIITVLIWVWADLAKTENYSVSGAAITVAKSANPNFWVSFNDESRVSIEQITLKGSASRIAEVKRKLKDGSLVLEFFLDPDQEQTIAGPGEHILDVLSFLKRSDVVKTLGLTVESCDPNRLSVNVVELAVKTLVVKCVDKDKNPLKMAAIAPAKVDMSVPKDWRGEKLTAIVQLTDREIEQARLSPVEKVPYIELTPGQVRDARTAVKITAPPGGDPRADYTITTATLGFTLSANLQGRYKVEVANQDEVMRAIIIKATPDAKKAYEKMPYQVILEINDNDAKATEPLRRELIYNFPDEYVRKDEIRLNQQPVTARFRLTPLPPAETAPTMGK
jgi:hypothetical protein